MKKVMVFGTFDILHEGHKNFFKQARKYGDYLITIIARDETVLKVKGKIPDNNENKRMEKVRISGLVDEVCLGDLEDKYRKIKEVKPDIICLGYDQKYFTDGLSNFNIEVTRLKPFKPKIYKTSLIKNLKL